jgi:hypothetical protein
MSMQFNSGRGLPVRSMGVHGFAVRWRPSLRRDKTRPATSGVTDRLFRSTNNTGHTPPAPNDPKIGRKYFIIRGQLFVPSRPTAMAN